MRLFWVLLFGFFCSASANRYCNQTLCKPNRRHIACENPNDSWGRECGSDVKIIPLSNRRKVYWLRVHNRLRNQIALGKLPGFPSAARMPLFHWDDDLAYLAELNVRQCKMEHDQCRNTPKYSYAGQNLATGGKDSNKEAIRWSTTAWFEEYKVADESYIDENHEPADKSHDAQTGHFTAMIQDRSNALGCAMARRKLPSNYRQKYQYWIACNYAFTNLMGDKCYTRGPPCSKCKTGCNKVYRGLCNSHEWVDPSPNDEVD